MQMLERYAAEGALRFHMPGHKGLVDLPGASYDVTEVPGTDCLFCPAEGLLEAEREAARAWGAARSRMLVNGSTSGVHAMVLWAAVTGRRLLLPRDCHVSAVYACAAAGLQPHWLQPVWNPREQLPQRGFRDADAARRGGPSALFVTTPDYYGRHTSVSNLLFQLRGEDCALLADAAHGAHFAFSPRFPQDLPLSTLWVTGAHKTLPAPTQTAHLHVRDEADWLAVARILRGITTTSPSYTLMAGLDEARLFMRENGARLDALIENCAALARRLNALGGLRCWTAEDARAMGCACLDPTRLVVDVRGLGLTGWEAGARLRALGIQAEMCDGCRVVLIATVMDGQDRLDALFAAFKKLAGEGRPGVSVAPGLPSLPAPGETALTLREAWLSNAEEVPLRAAAGRVAAEPFGAYPPGMPLVMPGEMITRDAVDTVLEAGAMGGSFFGVRDGMVAAIKA